MALIRLAARRLIAQRYLTLCMVVAIGFSVGALISGPIYADGASRAIVAGYLQRATPIDRNLVISTLTGYGFDPQRTTTALRGALGTIPISRIVLQEQEPSTRVKGPLGSQLGAIAYQDGIFSSVTIQEGREPQSPDEVAVPESVAHTLGVRPGDTLTIRYSTATTVRVSGVYLPSVRTEQSLYARGELFGGTQGLPLLTTADGFTSLTKALGQEAGLQVQWAVEVDLRSAGVGDLGRLATQEEAAVSDIRAVPGLSHATVSGRLRSLIPQVQHLVSEGVAPIYLVVLIIAALGLAVLVGIGALTLSRRSFELSVFKSRGARTLHLLLAQTIEGVLAAILGSAVAVVVGLLLALLARDAHGPGLPGVSFPIALSRSAVLIGAGGAAVAVAFLVLVSVPYVRRTVVEERRLASREERPVWGRFPVELILLLVGGIAYDELRRRGVQTVRGALDPIVLVAPMVLLLGAALFTIRVFAWLLRRTDGLVARFASIRAYLAGRRLSRTSAPSQAVALLLLLALSLFIFASSLRATVLTSNRRASLERTGADWNALIQTPDQILPLLQNPPAGTTPVFSGSTTVSGLSRYPVGNLVGVDPTTYPAGGWSPSGSGSLDAWVGKLSSTSSTETGVALPTGTSLLQVGAKNPPLRGAVLTAVVEDARGRISDLELHPAHPDSYEGPAPGATRLLSIVLTVPFFPGTNQPSAVPITSTFTGITAVAANGPVAIPLDEWQALVPDGEATITPGGAVELTFHPFEGRTLTGIIPATPPIPAVVAVPVSDETSVPVPSTLSIRVGELSAPIRVVTTIPAFPGVPQDRPTIVVDERTLVERFAQLLASPEAGGFVVLSMGSRDPTPAIRQAGLEMIVISSAHELEAEFASSPQSLALGIEFGAAVAAAILAVAGLGLALAIGERRRTYEFATLSAVGIGPPDVIAALAAEQAVIVGFAIASAFALGNGLLRLVQSSILPVLPSRTGLKLDWSGIAVTILATVATVVVGFVVSVHDIRSRPASAVLRAEVE